MIFGGNVAVPHCQNSSAAEIKRVNVFNENALIFDFYAFDPSILVSTVAGDQEEHDCLHICTITMI